MKKILFPIAIMAILLAAGCTKNILNTAPNNSVASNNVWTTDNLTDLGVAGVYDALKQGYSTSGGATNGTVLYDIYAMDRFGYTGQDYFNSGGSSPDDGISSGTATTGSQQFSQTWQFLYEGISRCNDAIVNMPAISPSVPTKKARYVAECKFLRAYFYYRLNQVYKGVPVYLTPTAYNAFNHSITSYDSVWIYCIQDLTAAINEPNLPAKYAAADPNYGHVTKGAAYALRGIVYQYRNMYDSAIADFKQVGNAGYALYNTGNPGVDYKNLFKLANEQCPEMIFSVQNTYVSGAYGYGGNMGFLCGTRDAYGGSGWDWYSASNELVDLYENADGTPFKWDNVIPGYSSYTPKQREAFFIRNNATAAELSAASGRGAAVSQYLPTGNEARIAAAYANRDPRLTQNVITPYSTYIGFLTTTNITFTMRWPYRSDQNAPTGYNDLRNDKTTYFLYWYRKFVPEGIELGTLGSDRSCNPIDFPLIRYADVLLRMAECYAAKNDIADALPPINLVRARAGMPALTNGGSGPTAVAGVADLTNRIRDERRKEFPNEGINYFDELRWGTWKTNKFNPTDNAFTPAQTYANAPKNIFGTPTGPVYVYPGDYILQWPVPTSVVQITNGKVAKTPGWTY